MSYMYFGKVNINSNIFEVYNNPSKIGEILKYLFEAIDQEKRLKVDEKNNIWAKFINIEKIYKYRKRLCQAIYIRSYC